MEKSDAIAKLEMEAEQIKELSHALQNKLGPQTDEANAHFLLSSCVRLGQSAKTLKAIAIALRGKQA